MKKSMKLMLLAMVFTVASVVGAIIPTKQAYAGGECNSGGHSGYVLVGNYAMYTPDTTGKAGALEIYWSSSEGRNCAIARAYGWDYGRKMYRIAKIRVDGGTWSTDAGYYYYYAGPVYTAYSRGKCIDAIGETRYSIGGITHAYRNLNNVHCG